MRVGFLGDIHADWEGINQTLWGMWEESGRDLDLVIQVGDMGFGMRGADSLHSMSLPCRVAWIDGNHENFALLFNRSVDAGGADPYHETDHLGWNHFLKTWEYMPRGSIKNGILFIGGALSHDKAFRTPGVDWWPEEQLSQRQAGAIIDKLENYQGEIHTVVSHDCPMSFSMKDYIYGEEYSSLTREFLEHVRQLIKPRRWFFGHYHVSVAREHEGCYYRCLNMVGNEGSYHIEEF